MRTNFLFKVFAPAVMLLLTTACQQQQSPSQIASTCVSTPGCPQTVASQTASPYGTLTPMGTNAVGPQLAQTPALANSQLTSNPVLLNQAAGGTNNFAKASGLAAAASSGSLEAGLAAKQAADAAQPQAQGPRVTSAAELGSDPSDAGAAGAR